MKRMLMLLALTSAIAACDKPTADECKSALDNMQKLMGTTYVSGTTDIQGEIRRCRGGSSKAAIQCASAATTMDELKACKFMGKSDTKPAAPPATKPATPETKPETK